MLSRRMSACYTRALVNGTMDAQKRLVIAIDGPSGAGKGTIARAVARQLGYRHVDTGAMYRAVAWLATRAAGRRSRTRRAVAALADAAQHRRRGRASPSTATTSRRRFARRRWTARRPPSPVCRRCGACSSTRQRALGDDGGIVMEGRDIGTVVFPRADVKIYLDADPAERARRRAVDPAHIGGQAALADVATAMADRDRTDATRAASPLVIAPDAIHVDTTGVPVDDVVKTVMGVVEKRLGAEG